MVTSSARIVIWPRTSVFSSVVPSRVMVMGPFRVRSSPFAPVCFAVGQPGPRGAVRAPGDRPSDEPGADCRLLVAGVDAASLDPSLADWVALAGPAPAVQTTNSPAINAAAGPCAREKLQMP